MTEWPIVPDSKSGVRATVPGVQIPLSPFDKCFWRITSSLQKARSSHVPFCTLLSRAFFVPPSSLKTIVSNSGRGQCQFSVSYESAFICEVAPQFASNWLLVRVNIKVNGINEKRRFLPTFSIIKKMGVIQSPSICAKECQFASNSLLFYRNI